jgi:hypothetical protein
MLGVWFHKWPTKQKYLQPFQSCFRQDQGKSGPRTWPGTLPAAAIPKGIAEINWETDKSRDRADLNYFNISRRKGFQISPCLACEDETVQTYWTATTLFRFKEKMIGQMLPNKLSKNSLIKLGSFWMYSFSTFCNVLLVKGKRLRLYNTHPTYITQTWLLQVKSIPALPKNI